LPCSFYDHAERPAAQQQQNPPCGLQKSRFTPFLPAPTTRERSGIPGAAYWLTLPVGFSWDFELWSLCVVLGCKRADDSHVHASLHLDHEIVHHL
jgi:hypothetical protein